MKFNLDQRVKVIEPAPDSGRAGIKVGDVGIVVGRADYDFGAYVLFPFPLRDGASYSITQADLETESGLEVSTNLREVDWVRTHYMWDGELELFDDSAVAALFS